MGTGTRRKPAVSGTFYPSDTHELQSRVQKYVGEHPKEDFSCDIAGVIVPHAGYVYSGRVAGAGYACLSRSVKPVGKTQTIFLIGPAHRMPVEGMAVSGDDVWESPLGEVDISEIKRDELLAYENVSIQDAAHAVEHSLEVQLPFLQVVFQERPFNIVPIILSEGDYGRYAKILDDVMDDNDLIVVSTDLSHYLSGEVANTKDQNTIEAVAGLDENKLAKTGDACGIVPLLLAVSLANLRDWTISKVSYGTSGDATGETDAVVGYVSMRICKK